MEVKSSHTYNVPVDAVLALLRDRDAVAAKYESLKHHDVRVTEFVDEADRLRIGSTRVVDVELPGFAKKFLKPTNTLVQTDEWVRGGDGSWSGTFDVEMHGSPVHLNGSMRLTPVGERCRHDVVVEVTVKVPLVGGRIADWAAKGDVQRSVDGEFSFNEGWLEAHPAIR